MDFSPPHCSEKILLIFFPEIDLGKKQNLKSQPKQANTNMSQAKPLSPLELLDVTLGVSACPHCINPFKDTTVLVVLPCGHKMCGSCVTPWFNYHHHCPKCNVNVDVDVRDNLLWRFDSAKIPQLTVISHTQWPVVTPSTSTIDLALELGSDVKRADDVYLNGIRGVLVLDRSGSMALSNRWDSLRSAAYVLINSLTSRDSLAVILFSCAPVGLIPEFLPMTKANRDLVCEKLRTVLLGSGTNISLAVEAANKTFETGCVPTEFAEMATKGFPITWPEATGTTSSFPSMTPMVNPPPPSPTAPPPPPFLPQPPPWVVAKRLDTMWLITDGGAEGSLTGPVPTRECLRHGVTTYTFGVGDEYNVEICRTLGELGAYFDLRATPRKDEVTPGKDVWELAGECFRKTLVELRCQAAKFITVSWNKHVEGAALMPIDPVNNPILLSQGQIKGFVATMKLPLLTAPMDNLHLADAVVHYVDFDGVAHFITEHFTTTAKLHLDPGDNTTVDPFIAKHNERHQRAAQMAELEKSPDVNVAKRAAMTSTGLMTQSAAVPHDVLELLHLPGMSFTTTY